MSAKKPSSSQFVVETMEERRLLAGVTWDPFLKMIGLDRVRQDFPNLTGTGQNIVVIDSGIYYPHSQLGRGLGPDKKIIGGWNFMDNNADPFDWNGHGTSVAGILVADGYWSANTWHEGIAPDAKIIALKENSSAQIKQALQWVIDHRVEYNIGIVNLTDFLGAGHAPTVYGNEIQTLAAAGVFIATPAGNGGPYEPIGYPSAYPGAYSVGAMNVSNEFYSLSCRGPLLDMAAPGENVTTTYYNPETLRAGVLNTATGTSYATPHVTGAATIIRQINPSLTGGQIMDILKRSAAQIYDPATHAVYPRLDLYAAVQLAYTMKIAVGTHGSRSASVYDSAGNLHLAYYDATDKDLIYAKRSPAGKWSQVWVVDKGPSVGSQLSIAIDKTGAPGIAYYDAGHGDLKYAWFNSVGWDVETVASAGVVGKYPSLTYNNNDDAGITYYDATNKELRLAYQDWDLGRWRMRVIDTYGDAGYYSSLGVNPANGTWAVAYINRTRGAVMYASQDTNRVWSTKPIDTTGAAGAYTSLAFDGLKRPGFSYYSGLTRTLKFAHFVGGRWQVGTVDASANSGLYGKLSFTSTNKARILYYDAGQKGAYSALGDIGAWSLKFMGSGGSFMSVATRASGTQTLVWLDSTSGNLRFKDVT